METDIDHLRQELNKLKMLLNNYIVTRGGRVVLGYSELSDTAGASPHDRKHDLNGTSDHIGITDAVENNFISFNENALPKDSGYNSDSFDPLGTGESEAASAVSGHESTYNHLLLETISSFQKLYAYTHLKGGL